MLRVPEGFTIEQAELLFAQALVRGDVRERRAVVQPVHQRFWRGFQLAAIGQRLHALGEPDRRAGVTAPISRIGVRRFVGRSRGRR